MLEVKESSSMGTFSFSVRIESVDKFKTLVKEINNASITFLIMQDVVNLIHSDSGFYICKDLEVLVMDKLENPIALRIDKSDFMNLLSDGIIRFTLNHTTNKISLVYSDVKDRFLYEYELPYQQDLIGNYIENLDAFFNYKDYPKMTVKSITTVIKIAKTLKVPLKCDGETVCVDTGNIFVYQKFKTLPFNVNSHFLWLLRSFSDDIYSVKEFFVVGTPDLVIAVNKYKVLGKHDFEFIKNSKSSYIVKFTLDNVLMLAKKLKLSSGDFVLNFVNNAATFVSGPKKFSTGLNVIQTKTATSNYSLEDLMDPTKNIKTVEPPIIKLPGDVFKGVFGNIPPKSEFTLYVKKSFIVICCDNLYIVFGKDLIS